MLSNMQIINFNNKKLKRQMLYLLKILKKLLIGQRFRNIKEKELIKLNIFLKWLKHIFIQEKKNKLLNY